MREKKSRRCCALAALPRLATQLSLLAFAGQAQAQNGETRLPDPEEQRSARVILFEGLVIDRGGAPVDGAVVVSSAGGRAVTDRRGAYALEITLPADADEAHLTAVAGSGQGSSARLALTAASGPVSVPPLVLQSTCSPQWLPTFGGRPGMDGEIDALAVFDDGNGPALYAGGAFDVAGAEAASEVVRWDGTAWTSVGGGIMNGSVSSLAVFDDGNGPALYAGGGFTHVAGLVVNGIARWDGVSWSSLGSGFSGNIGTAWGMTVFDDGIGPALFVGGSFTSVNGVSASNIAKWDGVSWSALGAGLNGTGDTLLVWDDGNGPALYVGGSFTQAGGTAASRIARWSGTAWSALGSGVGGGNPWVAALAVLDDGNGDALYAGGTFTSAGGFPASRIARWNGTSWSALGSGLNDDVESMVAHDDGGGAALYVGGRFTDAGGIAVEELAKWDGTTWSALGGMGGPPLRLVGALASFEDGSGARLVASGLFVDSRGAGFSRIASWDGASWTTLGRGLDDAVRACAWFDDGNGTALHVGGSFFSAGEVTLNRVGRWDGASWSALAGGVNGTVEALATFDDGNGAALYIGGDFTSAGGVPVNHIARWDGVQWSSVGSGLDKAVHCLIVHDDGSGPALFAGGAFTSAGGTPASAIARWNGANWTALAGGMGGSFTPDVYALALYDDGDGPALFAGGDFQNASGNAAKHVARWNGASWSGLGVGTSGNVYALATFDAGEGNELYAAGDFGNAGGVAGVGRIARWNGTGWARLAPAGMQADIFTLTAFDDGSGPSLIAGGVFVAAGGVAANRIARWDGTSWSALASGVGVVPASAVRALIVAPEADRQTLFAGGEFAGTVFGDSFLATWPGCVDSRAPQLLCPDQVRVLETPASSPGEVVFFDVEATDNFDPAPLVVCVPPSGSFFPRGATVVTCTATDASGNQSTCQFTVHVDHRVRAR